MTDYFTAHDVLEKVEGLNSLSTLSRWADFIQEKYDYRFHYDYIRFASHTRTERTINHRRTRMFSLEEIQRFQEVIKLIPILGRNTSLRGLSDKKHHLGTTSHNELLTEIINQTEVRLANKEGLFQALTEKYQQSERSYQTLERCLTQLEESLSIQEQTSSGWFRRKR